MSNTNLRWILVTAAVLMILPVINADVPNLMSYQGRLTDADGAPLTGTYNLTFWIYTAQSGGSLRWSETHNNVDVTEGLFSVVLGSQGNPLLSWHLDLPAAWLEVRVEGQVMGDRTQLTSVGYAQRIGTLDGAVGGQITGGVDFLSDVVVEGSLEASGGIGLSGPIAIESDGSNLTIQAGASIITISATGSVTISAQDITIDAGDVLTLTAGTEVAIEAPNVDVHATSTLDLRSDVAVAIDAGSTATMDATSTTIGAAATATINGSGIVDINGGLVQIN